MSAKENYFREAWIMLKQPFKFVEMEQPLQRFTVLYAYADQPLIKYTLDDKGKELKQEIIDSLDSGFLGGNHKYKKQFRETDEEFSKRINDELDYIDEHYSKVQIYEGHIVECTVEGVRCRFYPDEYSIISQDTFNMVVSGEEFILKTEVPSVFKIQQIKDKIFYMKNRGIPEQIAKKWASFSLKDAVYFKPRIEVLKYFCRDNEIYLPDMDYSDVDNVVGIVKQL